MEINLSQYKRQPRKIPKEMTDNSDPFNLESRRGPSLELNFFNSASTSHTVPQNHDRTARTMSATVIISIIQDNGEERKIEIDGQLTDLDYTVNFSSELFT